MNNSYHHAKKILIVGGGVSAWLTASLLSSTLSPELQISVLEPSDPIDYPFDNITSTSFKYIMSHLGFKESQWLTKVDGTFCSAIKLVNWAQSVSPDKTEHFWHCLLQPHQQEQLGFVNPWLSILGQNVPISLYDNSNSMDIQSFLRHVYHSTSFLCDHSRSPCYWNDPILRYDSAYHINAKLLVNFLKHHFMPKGVKAIKGNILRVLQNNDGLITRIKTKEGHSIQADLFIDCTGLDRLLIQHVMNAPVESFSSSLLCNSAVSLFVDTPDYDRAIPPYTLARAYDYGWFQEIPLRSRKYCSYYFSNDFISFSEAEHFLRAYANIPDLNIAPHYYALRTSKTYKPWSKNCIAIGSSACFVEPLTASHPLLTELGALVLISVLLSQNSFEEPFIRYNRFMNTIFDEIRDFTMLHYVLSGRNDSPFWQAIQSDIQIPSSLVEHLKQIKHNTTMVDSLESSIFPTSSLLSLLYGYKRIPYSAYTAATKHIPEEEKKILSSMPYHYDYLNQMIP